MIGYETGVILSGNMHSLITFCTTKIIVFKWCVCYIIGFFLENYEFSPHSVYPGQDLNRKRSQNADLCRDMYLSPATFPSLSIFKWQAWNLPDERDIEKYGLYFRLDSHNLNGANYKHKATTPRSEYAYIVDLVPFWSQKITHYGAL